MAPQQCRHPEASVWWPSGPPAHGWGYFGVGYCECRTEENAQICRRNKRCKWEWKLQGTKENWQERTFMQRWVRNPREYPGRFNLRRNVGRWPHEWHRANDLEQRWCISRRMEEQQGKRPRNLCWLTGKHLWRWMDRWPVAWTWLRIVGKRSDHLPWNVCFRKEERIGQVWVVWWELLWRWTTREFVRRSRSLVLCSWWQNVWRRFP